MKRAQRAELRSSPKANQKFEACIPNRRSRKPPLDVARPRATLQVQEIIYFVGQPDRTPDARQSSAAKEISRGDAEPRRMKGGNEASAASGITHSPERRTKRRESFIPNRLSRKPHVLGRLAGTRNKLFHRTLPLSCWIAAVSAAAEKKYAPNSAHSVDK